MNKQIRIDNLQYGNWSRKIFLQMREGGLHAVHVTIAYHEDFRELSKVISGWNRLFLEHQDVIKQGFYADDIEISDDPNRKVAIFFGLQTPAPIEADIGLVEILHRLGVRFMQLSYNNQSLLAAGCYEAKDSGITRMGREVIKEMNRVGLVVDMSHSGAISTLEAIENSNRPIAITHANPSFWHGALRNKSDEVIKALTDSGGMIGFSLYPHHLQNGSKCSLNDFCVMVAKSAEKFGVDALGIGSDLCQDQPDTIVEWMRNGRWTFGRDFGEGSAAQAGFPDQPDWFKDSRDFGNIAVGLAQTGFSSEEVDAIMGGNWYRFYQENFTKK